MNAHIIINGSLFEIHVGDIEVTVIERYALTHDTFPHYLSINPKDWILHQGLEIEIEDLKDKLKNVKYEDISSYYSKNVFFRYTEITRTEFGMMWIKYGAEDETIYKYNINPLKELSSKDFTNIDAIERLKKVWDDRWDDEKKELEKEVKKQNNINTTLTKIQGPEVSEFVEEKITVRIPIIFDSPISLLNIFDMAKLSHQVPFISLYIQGNIITPDDIDDDSKRYYKSFSSVIPKPEWIEESRKFQNNSTIVFKILKSQIRKDLYTTVVWHSSHELEYSYGIREKLELNTIKDMILNTINFPHTTGETREISIRGKMLIENFNFEPLVFLDMIMNDTIINNYLMVKEYIPPRKKHSAVQQLTDLKQRFFVYWWPKAVSSFDDSFSFTIHTISTEETSFLNIHITRLKNRYEVERFREFLSKAFGYYEKHREKVIGEYTRKVKGFMAMLDQSKGKKVRKKKTKLRLNQLRKHSDIFVKNYGTLCDAVRQPTIVPEDQIQDLSPGQKMFFPKDDPEGHWYVCESSTYSYPGLTRNIKLENKDTVPLMPCCFKKNQLMSKKSPLFKYEHNVEEIPVRSQVIDTIVGPGKLPKVYQQGELPFNIQRLFSLFCKSDTNKRIVRYAVVRDNNSFIHACLQATSREYDVLDYKEQIKKASEVRKSFAKLPVLQGSQELYGMSSKSIRDIINDNSKPLDAERFIRLAEIKFDINIFLFCYGKNNLDGSVLIPHHSQAFLSRDTERRKTIFIIIHKDSYEIIRDRRKISESYLFSRRKIIKGMTDIFRKSYTVFLVNRAQISLYNPEITRMRFIKDISAQYIDENGKVRALLYENGLYISISPLPPLNKKSTKNAPIGKVAWGKVEEFLNTYKFTIKGRNKHGILLDYPLEYGFIHTDIPKNSEIVSDFKILPPSFRDSLASEKRSLLKIYRYNKKVALYLREYMLYLYSSNPENFGKDNFTIIKNNNYSGGMKGLLNINNTSFIRNEKLIVPSRSAITKLLYYLDIMLFNQFTKVMNYKNRTLIQGEYDSISDFIQRKTEIIFLNLKSLIEWVNRKLSHTPLNAIVSYLDEEKKRPYLFSNKLLMNGKIVIIQNVKDGEKGAALNVSGVWMYKKYNLGYYSAPIDGDISYIVHSLNQKEHSINERDTEAFVPVLKYSSNKPKVSGNHDKYAAILEFT